MKPYPKPARRKVQTQNEEPSFLQEARKSQSNTLPPDIIANDRHTDDVLWNGPRKGSKVHKAGSILIGSLLLLGAMSLLNISMQQGGWWLAIFPSSAIGGFGLRILYKAFKPSN